MATNDSSTDDNTKKRTAEDEEKVAEWIQRIERNNEKYPRIGQDLVDKNLDDEDAKRLADALSVNTIVTKLRLGNNKIGNAGAQALADCLDVNTTLTEIDLRDNLIEGAGAQALGEVLKDDNTTLTKLNLYGNNIGDQGAQALADALHSGSTRLTWIRLAVNGISDLGCQGLASALRDGSPTLVHIDLEGNQITDAGAQALVNALRVNSTLTGISLADNQIKDNSLIDRMKDLVFERNKNSSEQAKEEVLRIRGVQRCIQRIRKDDDPQYTKTGNDLLQKDLTDEEAQDIADALRYNTTLTDLNLSQNKIGDAGAQAIAEALRVNTTLTKLNLGYNNIGDVGAQAFADTLRSNTALREFWILRNEITDSGGKWLTDALRVNTTLTFVHLGIPSCAEARKLTIRNQEKPEQALKEAQEVLKKNKEPTVQMTVQEVEELRTRVLPQTNLAVHRHELPSTLEQERENKILQFIKTDRTLWSFYRALNSIVYDYFIAAMSTRTGDVSIDVGSRKKAMVTSLLTAMLRGLPVVSQISTAFNAIVKAYVSLDIKRAMNNLLSVTPTHTEILQQIEYVTRRVTLGLKDIHIDNLDSAKEPRGVWRQIQDRIMSSPPTNVYEEEGIICGMAIVKLCMKGNISAKTFDAVDLLEAMGYDRDEVEHSSWRYQTEAESGDFEVNAAPEFSMQASRENEDSHGVHPAEDLSTEAPPHLTDLTERFNRLEDEVRSAECGQASEDPESVRQEIDVLRSELEGVRGQASSAMGEAKSAKEIAQRQQNNGADVGNGTSAQLQIPATSTGQSAKEEKMESEIEELSRRLNEVTEAVSDIGGSFRPQQELRGATGDNSFEDRESTRRELYSPQHATGGSWDNERQRTEKRAPDVRETRAHNPANAAHSGPAEEFDSIPFSFDIAVQTIKAIIDEHTRTTKNHAYSRYPSQLGKFFRRKVSIAEKLKGENREYPSTILGTQVLAFFKNETTLCDISNELIRERLRNAHALQENREGE